jgi:nucleoside-diphosphate-sugar epimerase
VKVLLTGANGFVGSHLLDALVAQSIPVAVLLRPTASLRLIQSQLPRAEIHWGSIIDPVSLPPALQDVTHVVHCAGLTKSVRRSQFHEVNQGGTRHLLEAVHAHQPALQQLILISSLAASHPATSSSPASEEDPSQPVTEYGRSKLAGETEIKTHCRVPYTILRPAAVYGPRDADFLHLFRAVQSRVAPHFGGGRQELSLVFAPDLAGATLAALNSTRAIGKTINVAAPGFISARQLTVEIARQLGVRPFTPTLPAVSLFPVCAACTAWSRITGRPHILSLEKYAELTAPGWVCRVDQLQATLGFTCPTSIETGIARTIEWYRTNGLLQGAQPVGTRDQLKASKS